MSSEVGLASCSLVRKPLILKRPFVGHLTGLMSARGCMSALKSVDDILVPEFF